MIKINFSKASFIKSATKASGYPTPNKGIVEVAVAGRSNVGKSTILNGLFKNKKLVKTSSTPGKTQLLNFFNVDDKITIVDLPGYGYAKVPLNIKKEWGPMIEKYLSNRDELKLVLFLLDIRREPNADDIQFLNWVLAANKALILVLTKIDKVSKPIKDKNTQNILKKFDCENIHFIHTSSKNNTGLDQLVKMIEDAIDDESKE